MLFFSQVLKTIVFIHMDKKYFLYNENLIETYHSRGGKKVLIQNRKVTILSLK